jgi:HK97 family phage major capsid protein
VEITVDQLAKALEKNRIVVRDMTGRTFPLGNGEAKAPGAIHSRGEAPYSLSNVIQSLVRNDKSLARMEWDFSEKLEHSGYACSLGGRSILVPLGGDWLWRTPGHEEAVDQLAKSVKHAFPLPAVDSDEVAHLSRKLNTKAMDALDDTAGGSLIPLPTQGELITLLRDYPVLGRAGAYQLPLPPQGAIHFPRETGDATFTWLGSNDTITDSTPSTGSMTLVAKRAGGLVKIPNDLIRYGGPAAEVMVRMGLMQRAALTEDLAFLEGQGGSTTPLGILRYPRSANNTPTADSVTLHNAGTTGTDGDTFQPEDVLKMMALVEEAPDPLGANAFIMRPLMFAGLANRRADAVTAGDGKGPFLFPISRGDMGGIVRKELAGLPVVTSTQVNNTSRKGSATNLTYLLCGNFTRAFIGRVGAIELAVSEHAGFAADQVYLRAILRVDFGLARPQSFVIAPTLVQA